MTLSSYTPCLKIDTWKTTFLLGRPIFRGYVSFREGIESVIFSHDEPSCTP